MKTRKSPPIVVVDAKSEPHALTRTLDQIAAMPVPAKREDRSLLPLMGAFSICCPSGDDCDYISIDLLDESSRIEFAELRIKYADFAIALTGLSHSPMTFAVRGLNLIGTRQEYKEENVLFKERYDTRCDPAAQDKALAPFEVDGWKGRRSDLTNHHHSNGDGTQRVHFSRHVDPATGKPVV